MALHVLHVHRTCNAHALTVRVHLVRKITKCEDTGEYLIIGNAFTPIINAYAISERPEQLGKVNDYNNTTLHFYDDIVGYRPLVLS